MTNRQRTRTSPSPTKQQNQLADKMTEAVTDAVLTIAEPNKPIDLHMVEVVHMTHKLGTDSRFVRGLVCMLLWLVTVAVV